MQLEQMIVLNIGSGCTDLQRWGGAKTPGCASASAFLGDGEEHLFVFSKEELAGIQVAQVEGKSGAGLVPHLSASVFQFEAEAKAAMDADMQRKLIPAWVAQKAQQDVAAVNNMAAWSAVCCERLFAGRKGEDAVK